MAMTAPLHQSARSNVLGVLSPLVIAGLAGAYGLAASYIPSPTDVETFWIGNTVAPWLMLAFWAGFTQRSLVRGAVAGALADVCAVVGFYGRSFVDGAAPLFMFKWMLVAVCVGMVIGALGSHCRKTGTAWPLVALAAAVAGEPAWRTVVEGFVLPTPAVWVVHLAVAAAIVAGARWIAAAARADRLKTG